MIKAFRNLREIHGVFDTAEQVLQETIGKSICIPNCGLCCRQNVPHWMVIEAIYAVSFLTGTGRLQKVAEVAEGWLIERHKSASIYEGVPTGLTSMALRDEFNQLARGECPFLDRANHCLIYEVRPLACRAYGVTRDNADICPRPPGKSEDQVHRVYIPAPLLRQKIESWKEECRSKNRNWVTSGFVPTIFYRAARESKYQVLVAANRIASAKLTGIDFETTLMWQPQIDAVRVGVSPEVALQRR